MSGWQTSRSRSKSRESIARKRSCTRVPAAVDMGRLAGWGRSGRLGERDHRDALLLGVHVVQPPPAVLQLAAGDAEVGALDLGGDRAALAAPHLEPVHGADGG